MRRKRDLVIDAEEDQRGRDALGRQIDRHDIPAVILADPDPGSYVGFFLVEIDAEHAAHRERLSATYAVVADRIEKFGLSESDLAHFGRHGINSIAQGRPPRP